MACAAVAAAPSTSRAQDARPANPVVDWNRFLLGIQATPGDQPATVHPTYELAILHAAIYDAVVSIDRSATPYLTPVHGPRTPSIGAAPFPPRAPGPRSASTAAAADAAAHDPLDGLYPSLRASIDAQYAASLAQ